MSALVRWYSAWILWRQTVVWIWDAWVADADFLTATQGWVAEGTKVGH